MGILNFVVLTAVIIFCVIKARESCKQRRTFARREWSCCQQIRISPMNPGHTCHLDTGFSQCSVIMVCMLSWCFVPFTYWPQIFTHAYVRSKNNVFFSNRLCALRFEHGRLVLRSLCFPFLFVCSVSFHAQKKEASWTIYGEISLIFHV